jgi:cysteinyl-tRNA synthetase
LGALGFRVVRLFNTLTGKVEELVPRDAGRVGMYVCGPTVQGPPHFGHARAAIVPDVLRRYLEWLGYEVFHVRNITDIDDRIIERALVEERHPAAVAEEFSRIWETQVARLGVLHPHVVPRATGHVLEMQELISRLIRVGAAYESGGDVFFAVRAFPEYGKLSGRNIDDLRSGARVEPDERKRDPLDFALWKAAKPGEPAWPSRWGPGRPGWHIECSAMAAKYLGEGFDIHAGGMDLVFPHHENEIAQSEAATGRRFARYWMHIGLLTLGAEKMSKSVGNIISLEEAIDRFGAGVLRHFYLSTHYRSPAEFSEERLHEAAAGFDRWLAFVRATAGLTAAPEASEAEAARHRFRAAMDDNFGAPAAQAALFDLVSAGNQHLEAGRRAEAAAARDAFIELTGVLGYRFDEDHDTGGLVAPLVEELVAVREEARAQRDFAAADRVRARLGELGIVVEDFPEGPRWHVARR